MLTFFFTPVSLKHSWCHRNTFYKPKQDLILTVIWWTRTISTTIIRSTCSGHVQLSLTEGPLIVTIFMIHVFVTLVLWSTYLLFSRPREISSIYPRTCFISFISSDASRTCHRDRACLLKSCRFYSCARGALIFKWYKWIKININVAEFWCENSTCGRSRSRGVVSRGFTHPEEDERIV